VAKVLSELTENVAVNLRARLGRVNGQLNLLRSKIRRSCGRRY